MAIQPPFQEIIFSSQFAAWGFFIVAYAILGAGIKYVDDAFDKKVFSRRKAMALVPLLGLLWAYSMALSPASAIILGAAGISSLLAGKVNNPAHAIGAIFILAGLLLFGIQGILWLPLAALALAGIADEIGNDFFEKRLRANKILRLFFEYRMAMKFAVFFLALLSFFGWEYFAGFLAFDLSYAAIGLYSQRLKPKPSQGYFSRPQ